MHFGFQLLAPLLLHYFAESNSVIQAGAINLYSAPRTEAYLGIMRTLVYLGIALSVLAVYKVYVRFMEKRTLTEFSRRGAVQPGHPTKGPTNAAELLDVKRIAARLLGRHAPRLAWLADQIRCYARGRALLGRQNRIDEMPS